MATLLWKNKKLHLFITIFSFSLLVSFSQTNSLVEAYKLRFPGDYAIVLHEKTRIQISLEKSDLIIRETYDKETFYYSNPQEGISDETIYTSSFNQISNLKAYFYQLDGKKFKRISVDNIYEKDDYRDNIFFDDRKKLEVVFPKVSAGTKTSIHYNMDILDPHFLGSHFFTSYFPVESNEFEVTYPEKLKLGYTIFNDPEGKIRITEKKSGKKNVLHCSVTDLDAFNYRENDFSISYYEPHIIVYIDNYIVGKDTLRLLSNLSDLHQWYYSFTKDVSGQYHEDLKDFTDSLSENLSSELEIAKTLYYWVQDNIKYIAFEDGYSGFIPRPSILVFNRRYGDCKDMANLCCDLLNYAGIESYLTWVGTRDIPYRYNEIPTPVVDNHLIVSAIIDSVHYFLDPTDDFLPINYPSTFIQGKEGLVSKSEKNFEVVGIPVIKMEENVFTDTSMLYIKENDLLGESHVKLSGYFKNNLAPSVRHRTPKKLKDLAHSEFQRGNNKFTVTDCSFWGLDNRDKDFHFKYSFVLPDYSRRIDNKIYLNLNLDRMYFDQKIDMNVKTTDKKFSYRFIKTHHLFLEVPDGYEITSLPEDTQYQTSCCFRISRLERDDR